ncbi:MAG: hypothetical protein JSV88_29635 [Candidatus Aminicenantes bacterium]|nr:MAG: hypothetical protein JSV88_29635 [Candidatus Aminicenantes bacterium]
MPVVKPSLIIGVGGTGYWILSLLKRQLYINYGLKTNETDEVQFLLLDTLSEEIFDEYKNETDNSIIKEYQVDRSEYIHLSEPLEGFFNWADDPEKYSIPKYQWFRRDILKQYVQEQARWQLAEGAAQLRQFGRMAFFFNLNKIAAAINEKLQKIKRISGTAVIPVWIFGSYAGGTGAGMMMDVAMLAKVVQDEFNHKIQTIGGFVLPEVYSDKLTTSIAQGYAGIRELQRFTAKGTERFHKADEDGKDHTGKVEFDSGRIFYHSKSIFDNMLFFNEDCKNEEKRRGFFNKVVDGISILMDPKGSDTFLSSIINHTGDRLTSLSTYKIFIPTALYKKKYAYNYLTRKINELFPVNEAGSILELEDQDKRESLRTDIDTLFSSLAPYFLVLQKFINNDVEAEKYARQSLLEKPEDMLEKLLGMYEFRKYYTDPGFSPNDERDIEALYENIYKDIAVPEMDKKKWEEKKQVFQQELENKFNNYKKIFDKSPENTRRENIKAKIAANFLGKVKVFLRDRKLGIREMYYTFKQMKKVLKGEDENNPSAIIGILNVAARRVFDSRSKFVHTKVIESAEMYSNIRPIKKLVGYNFSGISTAMETFKADKEMELSYLQSRNILDLVIEIHHQLLAYIERMETGLINKNNQVSISGTSMKARYRDEVTKIDGILKAGVGYATSLGLKSNNISNLKEKYEEHLKTMIFSEDTENIRFSMEFDGENYIINYKHGDVQYRENQEESLWDRIEKDIIQYIGEKMDLHAGIINYLGWARKQYRENQTESQFGNDLLNSLIPASQDFINLKKIPEKLDGRLVYGDTNPELDDEISDLLTALKNKSNCKIVNDTFRGAASYHIDFGDKDSLVFFVSSNTVHPSEIDILSRMGSQYKKEIQDGSGGWRTKVYHDYKCEWEIMGIESALPDVIDAGLFSLTHSSFYWVLEESENVEIFVTACAAGIIRKEVGATGQEYWICGPPGKNHRNHPDNVMCLTDPDKTSDMFTALVRFAVDRKPFRKQRPFDFRSIKQMRDEAILKQKGKNWEKIKNEFLKKDPFNIGIANYNSEISEENPAEYYIKHRDLFLARIFQYYLMNKK